MRRAGQAGGREYAVKRGDTLAKIAAGVKPEGVTLEQMLVSLYRNNTDAFRRQHESVEDRHDTARAGESEHR